MADITTEIAAYWASLAAQAPGAPVNGTHFVYMRLCRLYGVSAVEAALQPHIEAERAATARREAECVRAFYARFPKV